MKSNNPFHMSEENWLNLLTNPNSYPFPQDPCMETQLLIPKPIDQLWSFFSNPHNLVQLIEKENMVSMDSSVPSLMTQGMTFTLKTKIGFLKSNWNVHYPFIWENKTSKGFFDIQIYKNNLFKFPFSRWCHCHSFYEKSLNSTLVIDRIRWQSSLPQPFKFIANHETHRQLKNMMVIRSKILLKIFS